MDYKLLDGKLTLVGGDILLTSDYLDSVAQRLYIRLKSNFGKWFLDTTYGVDYYGKVFGKVGNKTRIDLLIKEVSFESAKIRQIYSLFSPFNSDNKVRKQVRYFIIFCILFFIEPLLFTVFK